MAIQNVAEYGSCNVLVHGTGHHSHIMMVLSHIGNSVELADMRARIHASTDAKAPTTISARCLTPIW